MPESFLDSLFSPKFQTWVQDFRQHAKEHSSSLTVEGYVRLLVIVCGYCLLRPYLVKLGGRFQSSDHDRELDDDTEVMSPSAISPNTLRGHVDAAAVHNDSDSEDEEGASTAPSWGKGARRRQREMLRGIVEEEERRKAEEEEADSDKEIEQFLRKVIE